MKWHRSRYCLLHPAIDHGHIGTTPFTHALDATLLQVIQDLTVVAVNDARSKIAESDAQEFNEIVGGLGTHRH